MTAAQHDRAGQMSAGDGVVTFCTCGLAFFAPKNGTITTLASAFTAVLLARSEADARHRAHVEEQP